MRIQLLATAGLALSLPTDVLGPGPKELLFGDEYLGYFGEVSGEELITYSSLIYDLGLGTLLAPANEPVSTWFKFIYEQKILFVAKRTLGNTISWNTLNEQGLVFGKPFVVPDHGNVKVRLLNGANVDPASVGGGEWDALLRKVVAVNGGGTAAWANYSTTDIALGNGNVCQETLASNAAYAIVRGSSGIAGFTNTIKTAASSIGWRPVLEWMPSSVTPVGPDEVTFHSQTPELYQVSSLSGSSPDKLYSAQGLPTFGGGAVLVAGVTGTVEIELQPNDSIVYGPEVLTPVNNLTLTVDTGA